MLVLVLSINLLPNQTESPQEKKKSRNIQSEAGVYGIVFFKTKKLNELKEFYINKVGCKMWMDQGDCIILKSGNMLFGFCQRESSDLSALITFFYKDKMGVDQAYETFKDIAKSPPELNKKYPIYHFFATDPEGRPIEFQHFTGPIDWDFQKYK
jgi:hypothetical protein